jgi:hypothetical protein
VPPSVHNSAPNSVYGDSTPFNPESHVEIELNEEQMQQFQQMQEMQQIMMDLDLDLALEGGNIEMM